MKMRFKLTLALMLTLALFLVWHYATFLLNMPNDFALAGGLVLACIIFILSPALYKLIFRRKNDLQKHATN